MSGIPPLRYRKSFRGNIKFTVPPITKDPESVAQIRYLKPIPHNIKGAAREELKLVLVETLTEEEQANGIFHFMDFEAGKKGEKHRVFYCIHCLDNRLEVYGVRLTLTPSPEPSGPKCQSDTPCHAIFERRKNGKITQLHCTSTTELRQRLAFGLQLKGLLHKSWKPTLIPGQRAVASRHIMDFELEIPKKKRGDNPSMSLLTVPL